MSKIVGTQNTSFTGKDGTQVEGKTIHTTEPSDPKRGKGEAGEKIFLSASKVAELDFTPEVGDEIEVLYNKFGKVQTLRLLDKFDIE